MVVVASDGWGGVAVGRRAQPDCADTRAHNPDLDRPHAAPPMVTIAIVPKGTTPAQLARVQRHGGGADERRDRPGAAGADIPRRRAGGADQPVPLRPVAAADPHTARRPGRSPRIPPGIWEPVRRRAADAPADLVPGLLGSTLAAAGVPVHAGPSAGRRNGDGRRRARARAAARLPGSELPGRRRRAGPPGAAPPLRAGPPWRRPPDRDRAAASGGRIASSRSAWRAPAWTERSPRIPRGCAATCSPPISPPRSSSGSASRSRTRSAASRSKPKGRPTPPSCSGSRTGWP